MFAFVARLLGGAVSPIVERVSAFGASLARKLALFLVAGFCFLVALAGVTIAFDLWIASMAGPIAGALAVAGVYLAVGLLAVWLAVRDPAARAAAGEAAADRAQADDAAQAAGATGSAARAAQIDRFAAPLLATLQGLGLRREQLAVFAGATMAKQLRPLPLVAVAILAGFLAGRLWKGWDALISTDLATALLAVLGLSQAARENGEAEDQAA